VFVDEAAVEVTAGRGGDGVTSFHREKYRPRGGPDGGDGGRGGDVVLVADPGIGTLVEYHFHPHQQAGKGVHGQGNNKKGADGASRVLPVPVGTLVRGEGGELLADLDRPGARFQAARGGRGGRGNAALSGPGRRVAHFHERGEPGQQRRLTLELRLLADAGLVGFPNAGKSSIVARVSAARPKVADYPFTTLEPHLGVVRMDDGYEYVVADIPGLIEGAGEGRGLGHRFLRHIERARVLCVLLDLAPASELAPAAQLDVLLTELEAYQPDLLARERVVVGSRADLVEGDGARDDGVELDLRVSAVTGAGVAALKGRLAVAVRAARAALPEPTQFVVHRPVRAGYEVVREGRGWVVEGREATRAVGLSDLTRADALEEAHRRLHRLGVDRALARAGAQPGDPVRIGSLVFEYQDDEDREALT
jgi:GTPase